MSKQRASGRVGGLATGYDVNLNWDGARIGGAHQGKDVHLSVGDGRVRGRHVGFDVRGTLGPGTLSLRRRSGAARRVPRLAKPL